MQWTSVNDIREKYLTFFESKGHLRHKSFPLVPIGDKSILLINAGMTPLKKYFTGEQEPPRHRMTTCQKCIRTPDIERVGITARHGTYFEMLGNFSFGDYFKHEAINWAWEFITQVLEMPIDKLWVTVYQEDDEAYGIWEKEIGVSPDHIVRLGKEDNFWEHGSGPCGPCSEIYFDRGAEFGCGKPDCKPGCDCDRYMEFWNLVFTQFENDGKGNYTRLAKPNIDTGMGLERLACIMQGVNNLFEVDTVRNIMKAVSEKAGVHYGDNEKTDISLRVITDHIRSTTFMVCDGVVPSNEGRGYVLRRLLRRAALHGKMLNINGVFLSDLCEVVAHENYSEYPELTEKLNYIKKIISIEEERFASTIDAGQAILSNIARKVMQEGKQVISGEDVFKLYDTFGFPYDLTKELAAAQSLKLDEEGFRRLMNSQKERTRAARTSISGWSDASKSLLSSFAPTEFIGYDKTICDAKVIGIIVDDMCVDCVTEGEFALITDKTVFYGEGGGQVGDTGVIYDHDTMISVLDTQKSGGVYIHRCSMVNGDIQVGDIVQLNLNEQRRISIARNHSACHLLQASLRQILGTHVEQAGSYVDEFRVRFDFTHYTPLTEQEIALVENSVNAFILVGTPITTVETDLETARKAGAMALFGEKYGKVVRMVKMGDFSTELCGGTHMDNTAKIGLFKITSESSVAAGIRRIEGVTGIGVLNLIHEKETLIAETAKALKVGNVADLPTHAASLQSELKQAKAEIESLESKMAAAKLSSIADRSVDVKGVSVIAAKAEGVSMDAVQTVCDNLKATNPSSVAVIAVVTGEKLNFIASCGKDALAKGAHAGNLVKKVAAICQGGGGGRPDRATAGGKDVTKVDEALAAVPELVSGLLK